MLYLPTGWFHEVTSFGKEEAESTEDNIHIAVNYWFIPPTGSTMEKPYTNKDCYWPMDYERTRASLDRARGMWRFTGLKLPFQAVNGACEWLFFKVKKFLSKFFQNVVWCMGASCSASKCYPDVNILLYVSWKQLSMTPENFPSACLRNSKHQCHSYFFSD